jgi:ubiquinone/menaquinone biosynthesis C-methylase UbiE
VADANAEQRTYWNEQAGPIWVAQQERLDRQIGPHGDAALGKLSPRPGERVLDVGCGTGTLAIAAKRRVGPAGIVHGIDASPEMIARARRKTTKAGLDVIFETGVVEALSFTDASFDLVLSTLMLHHLPRPARQQGAVEMRRVLRPGGRVLAVDFGMPGTKRHGLIGHLHRHGHVPLTDAVRHLEDAGMRPVESGAIGTSSLYFVLAEAPTHG